MIKLLEPAESDAFFLQDLLQTNIALIDVRLKNKNYKLNNYKKNLNKKILNKMKQDCLDAIEKTYELNELYNIINDNIEKYNSLEYEALLKEHEILGLMDWSDMK